MSTDTVGCVALDDKKARELSRAAKQAAASVQKRDQLIVEAVAAGGGVREVARIVGLNHTSVMHILRRDAKGATGEPPD